MRRPLLRRTLLAMASLKIPRCSTLFRHRGLRLQHGVHPCGRRRGARRPRVREDVRKAAVAQCDLLYCRAKRPVTRGLHLWAGRLYATADDGCALLGWCRRSRSMGLRENIPPLDHCKALICPLRPSVQHRANSWDRAPHLTRCRQMATALLGLHTHSTSLTSSTIRPARLAQVLLLPKCTDVPAPSLWWSYMKYREREVSLVL